MAARERLRNAPWLDQARPFFEILDGSIGKTRVVGGIVRDTLLGIDHSVTDIDMATVLKPEAVMERGRKAGFGVHPTGVEHGTVTLVARGISAEITTLRQDVETFGRHAKVVFGEDWEADARRRDFTMNALYAGMDGELFDPLAGLDDCLARRVRFIGNADARIGEDRLRVYRYFRFCATRGEERFEADALAACARASSGLDQLSAERIGAEMVKLLDANRSSRTLLNMVEAGVLSPEILPRTAMPALERLDAVAAGTAMRIAVLVMNGVSLTNLQKRWRLSNALRRQVSDLVAGAELAEADKLNELSYRLPDAKISAMRAASAVADWSEDKTAAYLAKIADVAPAAFPLDGRDLMALGVPKGKALGEQLRRLEQDWINSGFRLDRQALLERIRLP